MVALAKPTPFCTHLLDIPVRHTITHCTMLWVVAVAVEAARPVNEGHVDGYTTLPLKIARQAYSYEALPKSEPFEEK